MNYFSLGNGTIVKEFRLAVNGNLNGNRIAHPGKVLADFSRHGKGFGKRSSKGNTVPEQPVGLALDKNHFGFSL